MFMWQDGRMPQPMNVLGVGDEAGGPHVRLQVGDVVSFDGDGEADMRVVVELARAMMYERSCIFEDLNDCEMLELSDLKRNGGISM